MKRYVMMILFLSFLNACAMFKKPAPDLLVGIDIKFPLKDKVEEGDICFSKIGWQKVGIYSIEHIKKIK